MTIGYSARFDEALAFAACAHRGQARKGTGEPGVPYIVHPVQVATILMRHGFGEDLLIAGLLHDTVEDTETSLATVRTRFGAGVAALVAGVTEIKAAGGEKRPWRQRKEEQLAHLGEAGDHAPVELRDVAQDQLRDVAQDQLRDVAALKAADALHNCSATLADLRRDGPSVWSRFNASAADSIWYYRQLARLCGDRLGAEHPLVRELATTVEALAATVIT